MDKPNDSAPTNAPPQPEHEPTQAEWKAFSDALANAIFEPESIARVEAVVEENKRRQDQGRTDWVGLVRHVFPSTETRLDCAGS